MQPGVCVCPGSGIDVCPPAPRRAVLGGYWSSVSSEGEVGVYAC